MEAFKFAFETIVIGLLALPWLAVMIDLARRGLLTSQSIDHFIRAIPGDVGPTVLGIALFALAYVLGSAISPVACEFLNDEDWIGHVLPTEQQTQVRTYFTRMSLQERERLTRSIRVRIAKACPRQVMTEILTLTTSVRRHC